MTGTEEHDQSDGSQDPSDTTGYRRIDTALGRRRLLQTLGTGTLSVVAGCSSNPSQEIKEITLSGKVIDIEEDPVPNTNIHIYSFDSRGGNYEFEDPQVLSESRTDSSGEWERSLELDQNVSEVVILAKKSNWFDTVPYTRQTLLDETSTSEFVEQKLRREFLLEQGHTQRPPTQDGTEQDESIYYGTVSVWREFPQLGETDFQYVHTLLHSAAQRWIESGILSVQTPEDIWVDKNPVSDQVYHPDDPPPALSKGVLPSPALSASSPGYEAFADHADIGLEGPLSPAVGQTYLKSYYRPPEFLNPSESEQVASTIAKELLGQVGEKFPTVLSTATALTDIFQTLSDSSIANRAFVPSEEQVNEPDYNTFDTTVFGHESKTTGIERRAESFESMFLVTGIDWKKSESNRAEIAVRGVWNMTTVPPGGPSDVIPPKTSELSLGATIQKDPSLPWKESDTAAATSDTSDSGTGTSVTSDTESVTGQGIKFTLTVTDSGGMEVGSVTVSGNRGSSDFGERIKFATLGDFEHDNDSGIADFVRLGSGKIVENWSKRSLSDYTMIKNGRGTFNLVSAPAVDGPRALQMFTGPKSTVYISDYDLISVEPETTVKVDLRHETDNSAVYAMKTMFGVGVDENGQGGVTVRLINPGDERTAGASITTPGGTSRIEFSPDLEEFYTFSIGMQRG